VNILEDLISSKTLAEIIYFDHRFSPLAVRVSSEDVTTLLEA